ncbi:MAG: efflux RND transporter periplasmic adaptor subunit [Bacteroidetes bacterium]|nr:efflux RND transporter periplasmic adaptor subunit [Bacteroidota bacterium]
MKLRRNKIAPFFLLTELLFFIGCNNQSGHSGHENMNHDMYNMANHKMKKNDTIDLSAISLPTNYSVISSQKTVKPTWSDNSTGISANGYIAVDERRDNTISARFNGRIEKLFVKYNFQYVKKGEKIMEIYSAEFNTIQEEFLFLLKSKSEDELVKKVKEKLLLMGISDSQLKEIETSGKTLYSVSVLSPYDGYVYFTNTSSIPMPVQQVTQMSGMGMSSSLSSNQPMNISTSQIREGGYVSKGKTLFKVNDLKEVFGIILIDDSHSSEIKVGTEVEITSELDKDNTIKGKINLIEPVLQNVQKFLSARVYLKNEPGLLKINSLLTAKIKFVKTKQLFIPNSSILFLGGRIIVWLKTGEAQKGKYLFQVRDISIGSSQGNVTEILSGLTDKDEIALDAGYMIDRESLIKSK